MELLPDRSFSLFSEHQKSQLSKPVMVSISKEISILPYLLSKHQEIINKMIDFVDFFHRFLTRIANLRGAVHRYSRPIKSIPLRSCAPCNYCHVDDCLIVDPSKLEISCTLKVAISPIQLLSQQPIVKDEKIIDCYKYYNNYSLI